MGTEVSAVASLESWTARCP